jgi:heme/copper-type cytochrome/quinol oxidase subunit 2
MLQTTLFTQLRSFLLLISVISFFTLVFVATAQEEITQDESVQADVPYNVVITQKPLVIEVEDNQYTIEFTIQNNSDISVDVVYGATLWNGADPNQILTNAGEGRQTNLTPGNSEKVTFVYEVPAWLSGQHELQATLYATDGRLLDSESIGEIEFVQGQILDIEILQDSCFFILQDGSHTPFNKPLYTPENTPVSVQCVVVNLTEKPIVVVPQILLQKPPLIGGVAYSFEHAPVELVAQNAAPITFAMPEVTKGGAYGVQLLLGSIFVSNSVFTETLEFILAETPTDTKHTATKAEQNTVFVVIVTLLALATLLAILIYKRKSKDPLPDMHYPEN